VLVETRPGKRRTTVPASGNPTEKRRGSTQKGSDRTRGAGEVTGKGGGSAEPERVLGKKTKNRKKKNISHTKNKVKKNKSKEIDDPDSP